MQDTKAIFAQSQDLDLIIRHVLAGLGHGIHAGRERGAGVEFSEYRAYAPGDEWRRVDWKLLARADRYFVREAERDSHVAIWLWLDASASMAEESASAKGLSKLAYARMVLGCVAAIAQRQGDAFGLIIAGDNRIQFTPASRGPRQMHRILAQLTRCEAKGNLPDEETVRACLHFARAPSLIFAVSDFLEWPSATSEALIRLRRLQHDVRGLCLQTEAERQADFSLNASYCDPEQASGLYQFTEPARQTYLHNSEQHFTSVKTQCRQNDIPFLMCAIEQQIGAVLRAWLTLAGRAG
jgi:uncharacterized protein (DUF58 family)